MINRLPSIKNTKNTPLRIRKETQCRRGEEDFEVRSPKQQTVREYDAKRDRHLQQYFDRKYQHKKSVIRQRRRTTIATQTSQVTKSPRNASSHYLSMRKKDQESKLASLIAKMVNSSPYTNMTISQKKLLQQIRKKTHSPVKDQKPQLERRKRVSQRRLNTTVVQVDQNLSQHPPTHQQLQSYISEIRSRLSNQPPLPPQLHQSLP